jgi:hypothetical protein
MTRHSIAATLVALVVTLTAVATAPVVSAAPPCTRYAPEHCEELAAIADATLFAAQVPAAPVHILSGTGMGQEQFEATEGSGAGTYLVAVPTNAMVHIDNGYAPENDQRMLTRQMSN